MLQRFLSKLLHGAFAMMISCCAFAEGTIQGTLFFGCQGDEGGLWGFRGYIHLINATDRSVVMSQFFGNGVPYYFYSLYPYTFSGVPDGSYYIRTSEVYAQPPGGVCMDYVYPNVPFFDSSAYELATPIIIEGGNTLTGIDIGLHTGIPITGVVSTIATGVVGDVNLVLFDSNGTELKRSVKTLVANASGASAWYSFVVPAGTYHVGVRNDLGLIDQNYGGQVCVAGNCDVTKSASIQVSVSYPWHVSDLNLSLSNGGSISGTVQSDDESPISGATVKLLDSERDVILEMTTDSEGRYATTTGLLDGVYYLEAAKSGFYSEVFNDLVCVDTCEWQSGTPVIISGSSIWSNLDFSLTSTDVTAPLPNFVGRVLGARRAGRSVFGAVRVRNIGVLDAGHFVVKIYAARNPEALGALRLLRAARLRMLGASRSKEVTFSRAVSARYRWIILDIDPGASVYETSEANTAIRKIR